MPAHSGGPQDRVDRRRFPLQMHYQPVVDLVTGAVVGHEALARDTVTGTPRPPAELFDRARAQGRSAELDWACRAAALRGAHLLPPGTALFVNTDPAAAGTAAPPAYLRSAAGVDPALVRVLEVTERALADRPGPLLTMVDAARRDGWRIALDDVGVQAASLSLMPFLRPDVIKLDLRLVQDRTTVQAAEVVNAVAVQAAQTGAVVLAEGIETPAHAELARSMGASLGQGHLLGRPSPVPAADGAAAHPWPSTGVAPRVGTPWQQLTDGARVRRATKPLLVAVSRWLERQAVALGEPAVLLATFERGRYFSPATARRYADLAQGATLVGVYGRQMPDRPTDGVRGVSLDASDPLCAEWDVLVLGPHFAGALIAHDLGDLGPDDERRFDYTVTYDRDQVLAAAEPLLRRLPDLPDPRRIPRASPSAGPGGRAPVHPSHRPDPAVAPPAGIRHAPAVELGTGRTGLELTTLLGSALAASSNGVVVCDATSPDLPMVWVNHAFVRLTGYAAADLLGRNARVLQAPDADRGAVDALRAGLRAGREVRATLHNQRPDGTRWWNEMNLVPIRAADDQVTHWIGTQHDVTDRIDAERQVAYLAHHDALTGLANRRSLTEHLPAEIGRAGRTGTTVALLYLDLDGFKDVNDTHGHDIGDQLLVAIAQRLREHVRIGDLLVRQGGDEFLLVLSGLPGSSEAAARAGRETADKLRAELRRPFELDATGPLATGVSIGVSLWPHHASDAGQLLAQADAALYLVKAQGRDGTHLHGEPSRARTSPEHAEDPAVQPVTAPAGPGPSVARLRTALTSRVEVHQAVGLLMGRSGLSAADALDELHALSRSQALPLEDTAQDLLRGVTRDSEQR